MAIFRITIVLGIGKTPPHVEKKIPKQSSIFFMSAYLSLSHCGVCCCLKIAINMSYSLNHLVKDRTCCTENKLVSLRIYHQHVFI